MDTKGCRSLDEIGNNYPFLELGEDALQAATSLARIVDVYEVEMPLTAPFDTPAVAEPSDRIYVQRMPETGAAVAKKFGTRNLESVSSIPNYRLP